MFNEICIYEAKLTKLDEIEDLMKEVAEFYLKQDGVIDVHYIKRTHRQKDFNAVKEGELKFYKRWNRCLTAMPKIILGENVI